MGESLVPYLLRLKGMLKKHVFPSVLQQLVKEKMQCLGHGCHVADTCWEKKARVWFHTSPATLLLLKGVLKKHVLFPAETIQIATLRS